MNIKDYVSGFTNHPILFIGTGISLRYLKNSYTWDGLLRHVAYELSGNNEYYLDLKSESEIDGKYDYTKIAADLEKNSTNSCKMIVTENLRRSMIYFTNSWKMI